MRSRETHHRHATAADAAGIGVSALCVAHCLAFPAAAAAAPLLAPGAAEAVGIGHEWHIGLLAIAAPLSVMALIWGARAAQSRLKLILAGALGLTLMALGATHWFGGLVETGLTLSGVIILAGAHLANWLTRRRAGHHHPAECGTCPD